MTKRILIITCILISLNTFGQVKELENLRQEITLFVNYDNGKIDSLPKSLENSNRLKKNCELAFVAFIKNKDSKNLDSLKKNSIDNKSSYIIGNNNYFFHSLRKDPLVKSFENNVNYQITIYPLYDYKLSNFVSFYIQPIIIGTIEYITYYYKLNGKGTYYIKDVKSNEIVFQSEGLTSNAPIKKYSVLDKYHILFVEDLGDNGQRAVVVNTKEKKWKTIKAFNGSAFLSGSTDYTKRSEIQNRTYFTFAQSRTIISMYGAGFLKKYEIDFDDKTKTISYKRYSQNESEIKVINSKWDGNIFKIDDYYMGQDIDDRDLPMPN